jgi:hypothetical protein
MEDQLFSLTNAAALIAWIILILFQGSQWAEKLILSIVIFGLALCYTFLIFSSLQPTDFENFNTLGGLMELFSNPRAVLAGWIHYLAFDLMTGLYIVNNARALGINRWLIVPCLLFTFMLGPFGLLLYFVIRSLTFKNLVQSY